MAVQLARRLINVKEYYSMYQAGILKETDRVELIHGEIIEMSPIGSKHAAAVSKLNNFLKDIIKEAALINVQNPIQINDLNEPEPDLIILKPKDNYYADAHPKPADTFVIIEVSDSTYDYDKQIKLPLYASAGIPEFWLINLNKNEIEVHRHPDKDVNKKIEIARSGDQIDLAFCNKSIAVNQLLG